MPTIIFYLLKFSISLSVLYLFYQLVLRRLTFYNWNRWFLLVYSLLSFFIPFINVSSITENKKIDSIPVLHYMPVVENYVPIATNNSNISTNIHQTFNYWNLLLIIIVLGAFMMVMRLVIQFLSLQKIKRNFATIENDDIRIYEVDKSIVPFSFGNSIFINPRLHTEKEFEEIILHEYVHVKQKHTVDVLWSEFICMVNWYNPFAWLMRYSIRQNLEFIADDNVLKKGFDKKNYQHHLLKVIAQPQYRIANSFNISSLKKKIIMMNKLKSAKAHAIKFLFVLPLIAVLLLAFRDRYKNIFNKRFSICNVKGIIVDASTNSPLVDVVVKEINSGEESITNKGGVYSISVPIEKDSFHLNFKLTKKGYKNVEYKFDDIRNYQGFANVLGMFDTSMVNAHKIMMFMPGQKTFTENPENKDVMLLYEETIKQNGSFNNLFDFHNKYPDLQFYSTEDKKKQIVISKNGAVEKYGYPNCPSIADMEKKYGRLPDMFTNPKYGGGEDYVAKWQKISERVEKKFHTTNPNVKEIIFPGDSRVMVILKDGGKAKFYDMDNSAPEERPAFEKLYGKLPDVVPTATNNTSINKVSPNLQNDTAIINSNTASANENKQLKIKIIDLLQDYINDPKNNYKPLPTNLAIGSSPEYNRLVAEYNETQKKRDAILEKASSDNTLLKNINDRLDAERGNIKEKLDLLKRKYAPEQVSISKQELKEKKQELFTSFIQKRTEIDDSLKIWDRPWSFNPKRPAIDDKRIEELISEMENLVVQLKNDMKNLDPQIEKDEWLKDEIAIFQHYNYIERQSFNTYHTLNLRADTDFKLYFINFMRQHINDENEASNFIPLNLIKEDSSLRNLANQYNELQSKRKEIILASGKSFNNKNVDSFLEKTNGILFFLLRVMKKNIPIG